MTMTEPKSNSSDAQTGNGQLKDFVGSENDVPTSASGSGQEVNKVDTQSGGGSLQYDGRHPLQHNGDPENSPDHKVEPGALSKRGVSFQESIVAGYKEAPDPWKDAKGWNCHEVMLAYRKSCEKHNTKPLNRIIQQISGLVDNGKRQDLFSLKGEKLDHKHCESIEEILRRIQFRIIDLEACHLEDESAVALFDMIEFYDSACQVNISFNKNIGLRGWQACSKLIRRTPHLTHLDMRNCDLNERSIPIIGRALKLGSPLTVLHLENISLSGRALIILVAALKMNETLLELFLADNKLMPSDGIQLGNLLKYNHHLELLDLRNNHLQDVGTSHLCDGLFEQNLDTGLKTLVLWNNQITYQAMAAVAKALKSVECLETLNLGHNNITNEGMHLVKDGLLKSKALLRLGLQGTKVTCEGAVALAEFVADSPRLVRLDLRENDIKTAGLMALSLAMRVNDTVTRLDLDKDTKKESGMKDYAEQQRRLHQEIMTYAERNHQQSLEREARQKQEIEERARQEAARQSVEEAVKAAQDALHSEMDYIPSAEKIQRPKLLFSHILAPQQSLESPDDFKGNIIPVSSPPASSQNLSLCLPSTTTTSQILSTPPADMLLSPQYIPKLAHKKIFSVNKVTEPLPSPTLVAGQPCESSPAAPVVNLLTASQVAGAGLPPAISPTTLCQNLTTETVKEYIEQIVLETSDTSKENGSDKSKDSCDSTKPKSQSIEESGIEESKDPSQTDKGASMDSLQTENGISKDTVPRGTENNMETSQMENKTTMDFSQMESSEATGEENIVPAITADQTTGSIIELSKEQSIGTSQEKNEGSDTAVESAPQSECDVICDKDILEKQVQDSDPLGVLAGASCEPSANTDAKAEAPTTEMDQWQNVDPSDLSQSVVQSTSATGEVEKPDFHTNLSLNGLARELANALDGVDDQKDKEASASATALAEGETPEVNES